MAETHRNFVGGEWIESETGETFEVRNPADTNDLVGRFQRSGREDADAAVECGEQKVASERVAGRRCRRRRPLRP